MIKIDHDGSRAAISNADIGENQRPLTDQEIEELREILTRERLRDPKVSGEKTGRILWAAGKGAAAVKIGKMLVELFGGEGD